MAPAPIFLSMTKGPMVLPWSMSSPSYNLLLLGGDLQVGEISLGIGLGPQADLARLREGVVFGFNQQLAVKVALDLFAVVNHTNGVPFARFRFNIVLGNQFLALATFDLVEAEVVLQWVHADDVVV